MSEKTTVVGVRLTDAALAALDEAAGLVGVSRQEYLRGLLRGDTIGRRKGRKPSYVGKVAS